MKPQRHPAQFSRGSESAADGYPAFPTDSLRPARDSTRGASTFATAPGDGVYLFYDLRLGWLHLTAVLQVGDVAAQLAAEPLLTDGDRGHARLDGRLRITDSSAIL